MSANEVPIRVLLVTVFESVTEVFFLCMAGYILSRAGVTDKATQRKLNVINVSLFTPALLFSKVAFSLTPAKLKEMWVIPLGFLVVTGLSALVAWVLARIFRLRKSQTAFAICAAMFQNSNSLPIALIQSLVIEVPGLKWGEYDTKDQMLGRALTYLVLYSTLGMMLRWSWGVKLLSQADDEAPEIGAALPLPPGTTVRSPEPLQPHPGARETDPFFSSTRAMTQDEAEESSNPSRKFTGTSRTDTSPTASTAWLADPGSTHSAHILQEPPVKRSSSDTIRRNSVQSLSGVPKRRKPTRTDSGREFWGLPEAPRMQRTTLSQVPMEGDSSEDEDDGADELPAPFLRRRQSPSEARLKSLLDRAKTRAKAILSSVNAFMTVPMYSALLSIFIAMIPPLQAFLGQLKPLGQAIRSAGACSIPVTLVVLGAFFYAPPQPQAIAFPIDPENDSPPSDTSNNTIGGYFERKLRALAHRPKTWNDAYPGENKTVFVAVISRMILVPLLMLPLLAAIAKYDLFEAAQDPVFILSAVLLVSSPPALTLAQITQAASGDAFERLISKTISWSYAVLTPPLTLLYVVIGLVFGRL